MNESPQMETLFQSFSKMQSEIEQTRTRVANELKENGWLG